MVKIYHKTGNITKNTEESKVYLSVNPKHRTNNNKSYPNACCHENKRLRFPGNSSANIPPSSCLQPLPMRFDDARAAAAVLILTPVSQGWSSAQEDEIRSSLN